MTPHTCLDQEFDRMLETFNAIAQQPSALRRRFELARIAPLYGLPRSEFRKLFELWLVEALEGKS